MLSRLMLLNIIKRAYQISRIGELCRVTLNYLREQSSPSPLGVMPRVSSAAHFGDAVFILSAYDVTQETNALNDILLADLTLRCFVIFINASLLHYYRVDLISARP